MPSVRDTQRERDDERELDADPHHRVVAIGGGRRVRREHDRVDQPLADVRDAAGQEAGDQAADREPDRQRLLVDHTSWIARFENVNTPR